MAWPALTVAAGEPENGATGVYGENRERWVAAAGRASANVLATPTSSSGLLGIAIQLGWGCGHSHCVAPVTEAGAARRTRDSVFNANCTLL